MKSRSRPVGRLNVWSIVILAIACGIGIAAGVLTYLASRSVPHALLAAGTATGSSAELLRQISGPDRPPPASREGDDNRAKQPET